MSASSSSYNWKNLPFYRDETTAERLKDMKIAKASKQYVFDEEGNKYLAASITPHHLTLNRNAIFVGGIRPHNYCLPILKREFHRKILIQAAVSGNEKFFLKNMQINAIHLPLQFPSHSFFLFSIRMQYF